MEFNEKQEIVERQTTKTPEIVISGVFLINAYAREPLIYKGLLGVKIHYIIALLTK